ncbi:MAG: hypothetical protein Tsb0020_13170 [Haliangiales bacterium]
MAKGPPRRLELMRSLIFITLLCSVALGLSCATVENITDDFETFTESVGAFGATKRKRPPVTDCQKNQARCIESRLGPRRGGRAGHSLCQDCRDLCVAQGG